ncbi:hypothetical protein [Acidocella facilis]|uniref:hypothetical protein n=1 Tax=Acidocella facilis TaxID=525 RepID=UPI001F1DE67A|nr:hypothetical protein [Acidocella facilis]
MAERARGVAAAAIAVFSIETLCFQQIAGKLSKVFGGVGVFSKSPHEGLGFWQCRRHHPRRFAAFLKKSGTKKLL